MVSNWTHALLEGWAEVFEGIFEPSAMSLTGTSTVRDGSKRVPLGPDPPNQGLSVEGAFAQGMIGVLKSFVVGGASGNATVPRTFNGDVTQTAPWVKDPGVRKRFKSAIWGPLHAVRASEPWTADFVNSLETLNPGDWPGIVPKLNEFNIAMDPPQIESISPASGPAAGGQPITIVGSFFHPGRTQVTVGGKAITGLGSTGDDENMYGNNERTVHGHTPRALREKLMLL